MKHFHSKAVTDATQNFPTGPVSTFLLTWPDPSPPQTRIFRAVGSTRPNPALKQTAPLPTKWQRSSPGGQHRCKKKLSTSTLFRCTRNIFKFQGAPIKPLSRIRAGRVFSASQNKKSKKKTCSYPVTPQCITRRFRLNPRSAKRPGPFGFTNIWRTWASLRAQ